MSHEELITFQTEQMILSSVQGLDVKQRRNILNAILRCDKEIYGGPMEDVLVFYPSLDISGTQREKLTLSFKLHFEFESGR